MVSANQIILARLSFLIVPYLFTSFISKLYTLLISTMRVRIWISALVVLFAPSAYATALASYTPQFSVYVDSTRELTIDEVVRLPANAFKLSPKAGYVGGYNRAIHWLKFTLEPFDQDADAMQYMRISPTYLDSVTLYIINANGEMKEFVSGELQEDWAAKHERAFVFDLPAISQPTTAYIRLETINTHTLVADVYSRPAYFRALLFDYTLSGIFIGLLFTLLVINLSHNKWRSDENFRYYLLFVAASLLVFLTVHGWLALWLSNGWKPLVNYLPQLTTLLYLFILSQFYHALFAFSRKSTPTYFALSRVYQLAIVVGVVALAMDFYIEYMPWFMQITLLYLLLITGFAIKLTFQKRKEGRLLFLAVVFGFSGLLGTALSLNGWVSGGALLMYSYTAGTLASIFVFQAIMSRRIRQTEQDHLTAVLEMAHAQQIAIREKADKEQKAAFLSMLSHELKTPLSVIRMGIDQKTLSDRARAHLYQAISDMSMVIDRCAVLEKVDDQIPMRKELVDLAELIHQVVIQSGGAQRIDLDLPTSALMLHTDEDWLRVILSNLIDNALKYSPKDTQVHLQLALTPGWCCILFSNQTRCDLPDASLLFKKYYRAKSAHKQTGSGLGLYIVKRLVDQLNAQIEYQAITGEGAQLSTVSIRLCLPQHL